MVHTTTYASTSLEHTMDGARGPGRASGAGAGGNVTSGTADFFLFGHNHSGFGSRDDGATRAVIASEY